jgi:dipicolinate synthase subunit A
LIHILASKGFKIRVLKQAPAQQEPWIIYSEEIDEVIKGAKMIIAPMSGTDEEGFLKSTFVNYRVKLDQAFFEKLSRDTLFMIGIAGNSLKQIMESCSIRYLELARLEEVAILNAIPTAEGAIKLAIEETDYTIFGSKSLVLGLGKVGLTLAWRLRLLGADTYAVTRNRAAIARGRDLGIKMLSYDKLKDRLPEIDMLFNTVPALILDREYLSILKRNAIIIDLASSPGGTDFQAAEEMGIKALLAPGLPGKIAPRTAGEILADIIPELMSITG